MCYPLPTSGILVAMQVMESTLAESGSEHMYCTAFAASSCDMRSSGRTEPSACGIPTAMPALIALTTLP